MLDELADFLKGTSTVVGAPGMGGVFTFFGAKYAGLDAGAVAILTLIIAGVCLFLGYELKSWAEDRVARLNAEQIRSNEDLQ